MRPSPHGRWSRSGYSLLACAAPQGTVFFVQRKRVVVLGPGGSGKSTFARSLSEQTGIRCTELDSVFWSADLRPTLPTDWAAIQERLCQPDAWILDGDLGPYDIVDVRLQHADAVVVFDLPTWRCAWGALRRSRARLDFWRWLLTWRRRYRPKLIKSIRENAPAARLLLVRDLQEADRLVVDWDDLTAADSTTSSQEVLAVLGACDRAEIEVWLDGGWGVDALLGQQHRPHSDVDIIVPLDDINRLLLALRPLGYAMAESYLPTRAVLRNTDGRQIDLHPIAFDDHGNGWQAQANPDGSDCRYPAEGFVTGAITGHVVPCLNADVQLAHHMGYEPRPHDRDDMRRLAAISDIELAHPYNAE